MSSLDGHLYPRCPSCFSYGLGISPSHVLSITALHVLTLSKEESKHLFHFEDSVGCPQIVRTRRA
jgi:hypothetical protein